MEVEKLDALIAERAGVSAKTVRNLRGELGPNGRGWLKPIPVKNESGAVLRWDVGLADGAPGPVPDPVLGDLVPDPTHPPVGHSSSAGEKGDLGGVVPECPQYGNESGTGAPQERNTAASPSNRDAPDEPRGDGLGGNRQVEVATPLHNGHSTDDEEVDRLEKRLLDVLVAPEPAEATCVICERPFLPERGGATSLRCLACARRTAGGPSTDGGAAS
jgi:hypothetical protein